MAFLQLTPPCSRCFESPVVCVAACFGLLTTRSPSAKRAYGGMVIVAQQITSQNSQRKKDVHRTSRLTHIVV